MTVLVADAFERAGLDALADGGCRVRYAPRLSGAALAAAVRDEATDVLIVRSTVVAADALEAGRLSLVVRAGAGYDTIDVGAASRRGIYVANCPGRNAIAVAELTIGLLLALDRRIADNVADLRAGQWNKAEYAKARGLYGRSLAILGFGAVAQEVARRAQAFGMRIVVWSRRFAAHGVPPPGWAIDVARTPEEAAADADALSVHLALAPDTRGLVGAAVLGRLKPGAVVVNTARAEIVDRAALERGVRDRGLRAGVDVHEGEPKGGTGAFGDPFLSAPGVYGTHHIGASTDQAQEAVAAEAVRLVLEYKVTGRVPNAVNVAARTPATHALVVRHRDRPGVLADVLDALRRATINVQEMENVVFAGAEAAAARIHVDAAPPDALLQLVKNGNDDILDLHVIPI